MRRRLIGTTFAAIVSALPVSSAVLEIGRVTHAPSLSDFAGMTAPPALDGMKRLEGFTSRIPKNGLPISERTVAYVGYDNAALYIVFLCFDRQPERMRARLVNRDLIPGDDDTVAVFLDTFHDRKRCYGFQVNGRGVQNDAIWTEGGTTWDFSYDGVWQSDGRTTGEGYVALFAIPFKSLRFPPRDIQEWGIFLYRGIPRKNEEAYWPPYSSQIAGRLNQEGDLRGLESVSPGRNLQFIPYTSFLGARTAVTSRRDADMGVDGKMIIRDSIVADVTVNPDFSQVESDVPQETVNQRFEVFFPEKRPFFIENASYFTTPIQLLFTRRIADPQHGLKLTGKIGSYGSGALAIDDRSPGELAPIGDPLSRKSAFFRALRITRDVGADSSVGGTFVERSIAGMSNSVGGLDARLRLNQNWFTSLQGVVSRGSGDSGSAYRASLIGSGTNANYEMDYDDRSDGFRADAGFITRVGIRQVQQTMSYHFRPQSRFLLSWGPDLLTKDVWDHAGGSLEHAVEPKLTFELPRQTTIAFAWQPDRQRLIPREFPALQKPLSLSGRRWGAEIQTSALPRATAYVEYIAGTTINFVPPAGRAPYVGEVRESVMTLEFHPSDSWTWQNNFIYTALAKAFTHRTLRSKISYQFSRPLSVRVIFTGDHLDVDPAGASLIPHRKLNADFLITYLLYPGTAMYLGYNANYANADPFTTELENDHRQLFIKISYLVRF
ncbi:MAG TPA: DUF5916 domain-containing protein [Thermoanaerobaculia bacterium]|nr:DUF5916 domain-containing protein [Thermoanaerobaculia bacterium]